MYVFLENFRKVLSATVTHKTVPFNFDSTFVKQYFGETKTTMLSYHEFAQLLQVHSRIQRIVCVHVHMCWVSLFMFCFCVRMYFPPFVVVWLLWLVIIALARHTYLHMYIHMYTIVTLARLRDLEIQLPLGL